MVLTRNKYHFILSVLFICVFLFSSCADNKDREGGESTLIVGEMSNYEGLNPMSTTDAHARDIYNLLFLSLLDENDDFLTFSPRLAHSWEFSDDRRELTFHLREDVTWSDGRKFTSEDVAATFRMQVDTSTVWSGRHLKEHIDSVEVVDEYKVVYHFNHIYPYQLMDAVDGPIMPAHIIETTDHGKFGRIPAEELPVTGPFEIEKWEKGQSLILAANENYYEDNKPRLNRVIFKIIPDQVTLVTQLLDGEIDCMESVPPAEVEKIKKNNNRLRVFDFPTRAYIYLGWNGAREPFDNPRVRRALTMAIDRKLIIDNLYYGYAEMCCGPFVPLIWAYNPDLEPLPFDPDEAEAILREEGYSDEDGDGFLDKNGKRLEFSIITNHGNQIRADIQVMIQQMLSKIGVKVNPVLLEWTVMLEKHKASDFDGIISAWRVGTKADLAPIWSCRARGKGGYNRVDYCNSEVDSLNKLATSMLDFEKAKPLFCRAQQIIHDDQPYTFLYIPHSLFVISKRFGGVEPDAIGIYHYLYDWYAKN
ncbi:MAG: peptide-binding protein [Candidatus Krumholzibacteriota bacterium]|nr:peptide-binding protein [Candidatus Krumholzibacteriota bacterium]